MQDLSAKMPIRVRLKYKRTFSQNQEKCSTSVIANE